VSVGEMGSSHAHHARPTWPWWCRQAWTRCPLISYFINKLNDHLEK